MSTPFSLVTSAITDWLTDKSMIVSAQTGISIGIGAYDEIPARMKTAPRNLMGAYEQAVYFLALAARRAMRGEESAQTPLLQGLNVLLAEASLADDRSSLLCSLTGIGCPTRGSGAVLQEAIDIVEQSGLNPDDVQQIVSILAYNKRIFQLWQAAPYLVLVAAGAAAGTWWWHRSPAHESEESDE